MKKNLKKLLSLLLAVLMTAAMSMTALADTSGDFDGKTMSENEKLNYTVICETDYTDVSGVKLTWSVPVVKYDQLRSTVWNTSTLKWDHVESTETSNNTATFKLVNRSSEAVIARVAFALEESLQKDASVEGDKDAAAVAFDQNDVTIECIVDEDTKEKKNEGTEVSDDDYLAANCTQTITGTVSFENASKLTAASGKLGTYTVSIRGKVHSVSVTYLKNAGDAEQTTETVTVEDGAKISVDGRTLKIGEHSFTDASAEEGSFSWCVNDTVPVTAESVLEDMYITACVSAS